MNKFNGPYIPCKYDNRATCYTSYMWFFAPLYLTATSFSVSFPLVNKYIFYISVTIVSDILPHTLLLDHQNLCILMLSLDSIQNVLFSSKVIRWIWEIRKKHSPETVILSFHYIGKDWQGMSIMKIHMVFLVM